MPSKAEQYSHDTENTDCWTFAQEGTHHTPIPLGIYFAIISKVPDSTFALPVKCRLEFVLESPRILGTSEQGYEWNEIAPLVKGKCPPLISMRHKMYGAFYCNAARINRPFIIKKR